MQDRGLDQYSRRENKIHHISHFCDDVNVFQAVQLHIGFCDVCKEETIKDEARKH